MRTATLLAALALSTAGWAATPQGPLPLPHPMHRFAFEPNQGQTDSRVQFLARTLDGVVFFTRDGLVLSRSGQTGSAAAESALRVRFAGASAAPLSELSDPQPEQVSYHVGRDRRQWVDDVQRYGRLTQRGVYPGIDVSYYGSDGRLEYDFVVAPHADPRQIRFAITGARETRLNDASELEIITSAGTVVKRVPAIYQVDAAGQRARVGGRLVQVARHEFGFALERYDPAKTLYIDPVLEASQYLGGSDDDRLYHANGTNLIVGTTASIDFPLVEPARRAGKDIFIQRKTQYGVQSLIVGGSGDDEVAAVSTNSSYVVIAGNTTSPDLPTSGISPFGDRLNTVIAWQPEKTASASNGFVILLSTTGTPFSPLFTYLGGSGETRVTACSLGSSTQYAITGTTTTSDLVASIKPQTPRPQPRGGTDAFLLVGYGSANVVDLVFFGGSGDDTPRSVLYGPSNTAGSFLTVGGETTSNDFPLLNPILGQRAGASDAFLTRFSEPKGSGTQLAASTLYGGSGSESINSIVPANEGSLAIAGVTSSTDFPLLLPTQRRYGGGASDAFVVRLAGTQTEVLSSTVIGGSGDDAINTGAIDFAGGWYFGGTTSSPDLKTTNAVQSTHGGGRDGLLVEYLNDASLLQLSYWGGSGDDEILGLGTLAPGSVVLAGVTSSSNLALQPAANSTLKGINDGFIATITTPLIQAKSVFGGEDLRSTTFFSITGPLTAGSPVKARITSQNPLRVRLALNTTDTGTTSVEIPITTARQSSGFYYDCLTSSGTATLKLEAPGYLGSTMTVSCNPATPVISIGPLKGIVPGSSSTAVSVTLAAYDPATGYVYGMSAPRPGSLPKLINVQSDNPAVGSVSPSAVTISNSSSVASATFVAGTTGTTTVTATARGTNPTRVSSAAVSVGAVLTAPATVTLLRGFQSPYSWTYSYANSLASTDTSIMSDSGELVAISRDRTQPGTNSVVFPGNDMSGRLVYLQPPSGTGNGVLRIATDGPSATVDVRVVDSGVFIYSGTDVSKKTLTSSVGANNTLSLRVGAVDSELPAFQASPVPQKGSLHMRIESSDPTIAVAEPSEFEWTPSTDYATANVRGLAEGTTTLKLIPPDGVSIHPIWGDTVTYQVSKAKPTMKDMEVGKDLAAQGSVLFTAPIDTATTVTVRVAHPELAQLARSWGDPGAAEIQIPMQTWSSQAAFYVYGLAGSGITEVMVDAPGFGSTTAKVTLDPSAPGWRDASFTTTLYSNSTPYTAAVSMYVLDPPTGLPIGKQVLRPGVSKWVHATSSNSAIAALTQSDLELKGTSEVGFAFNASKSGNTTFALSTIDGTAVPEFRRTLPVTIAAPALPNGTTSIPLDMQTAVPLYLNAPGAPAGLPVTLTSSDASKLVLSTSSSTLGSGTVTVPREQIGSVIFQALSGDGSVNVKLTAANFSDGSIGVSLIPLQWAADYDYSSGGMEKTEDGYSTTTLSVDSRFTLRLASAAGSFLAWRPGAPSLQFQVASLNPRAGTVSPATVTLTSNQTLGSFTFKPAGAGRTRITIAAPDGITAQGSGGIDITVTPPALKLVNIAIGKDLQGSTSVMLPSSIAPQDGAVHTRLVSSDPSRLLLSLCDGAMGTASINVEIPIRAGGAAPFCLQALAGEGNAQITATADQFSGVNSNVRLLHSTVVGSVAAEGYVLTAGTTPVTPGYSLQTVLNDGSFSLPENQVVRPGASVTVELSSTDPGVFTVSATAMTFAAGQSYTSHSLTPTGPGKANLIMTPPGEVDLSAGLAFIPVTVKSPELFLSIGNSAFGKNLGYTVNIYSSNSQYPAAGITVTSSDPTKMLVAPNCGAWGGASTQISSSAFCLEPLTDSGTATVTISANGYTPAAKTVAFSPVAAVLPWGSGPFSLPAGSTASIPAAFATFNPNTQSYETVSGGANPLPGRPLTVEVTSSNPQVLKVSPATVQFDGFRFPFLTLEALSTGNATISLGTISGGVLAPENLRTAEYTVGPANP